MSDNELMIVSDAEIAALAGEMGASAEDLQGGGNYLPSLKVWGKDDGEEEDAPRLKGKMVVLNVPGYEEPVFVIPGTISFRPLTQVFQYTHWDDENKKTINRTRLAFSFKEEFRDEKGTVRCGKPASKDLKDNKALQKQWEDVKVFRRVQGLLTFTGYLASDVKNTFTVTDLLSVINSKGANFLEFDDEFVKKLPPKSFLWDWSAKISTTRHVNGQVTYWCFHYEPDFTNKLKLTRPIMDTISGLKNQIEDLNTAIDKKYYDAINGRTSEDDAIGALKTVGSQLDDDMSDDIPF